MQILSPEELPPLIDAELRRATDERWTITRPMPSTWELVPRMIARSRRPHGVSGAKRSTVGKDERAGRQRRLDRRVVELGGAMRGPSLDAAVVREEMEA